MRILLVEDEKKIASFIRRGLREENYVVDIANEGDKGFFLASVNPYDLIILDIMLPQKDGLSICRDLRKNNIKSPILILTAKDAIRDKVTGLDCGADDYLTKPFAFDEFLARVRALIRRKGTSSMVLLKVADLEMNQITHDDTSSLQLSALSEPLLCYLQAGR